MTSRHRKPSAPMSHGEAQVHLEAGRQRQERHAKESLQSFDRKFNDLRAYQRWSSRWGPWMARVALVPLVAFLASGCYLVALAVLEGRTMSFGKYSREVVVQAEQPLLFWVSVAAHVALTAYFAWLVVVALREAKLRG